jgi:hypothetical protein
MGNPGERKMTVGTRQRRKTAHKAVRDYGKCVWQLEALREELGPPLGRGWMQRNDLGQMKEIFEPSSPPVSWSLEEHDLRSLRASQRQIRRYGTLLRRAHTLSLKAAASLERLQRLMRRKETVGDVLRRRKASTH